MSLKPRQPQTPARIDWELEVTEKLAERMDCDCGDASGVMDFHVDLIDRLFAEGVDPDAAAAQVDEASTV
mgnify:CR=1 FL=1